MSFFRWHRPSGSMVHSPAEMSSAGAPQQAPGFYRIKVGDAVVTTFHDGHNERPLDGVVRNAPIEAVKGALEEAFLPTDTFTTYYHPLLIETGGKRVLIDPGFADNGPPSAGQLARNMAAAGVTAESIDVVVATHLHPDHIQGIRSKAGALIYPNATLMVPEPEWAFWTDEARAAAAPAGQQPTFAAVKRVFAPVANEVVRYGWGSEVVAGLTSVGAPGHTPGMSALLLESAGQKLLVQADTTNLPALFVRHPGWHLMFDMDPVQAEATRRRILDMAAEQNLLVAGFHYPFPAIGRIAKDGDGYRLGLVTWRGSV